MLPLFRLHLQQAGVRRARARVLMTGKYKECGSLLAVSDARERQAVLHPGMELVGGSGSS